MYSLHCNVILFHLPVVQGVPTRLRMRLVNWAHLSIEIAHVVGRGVFLRRFSIFWGDFASSLPLLMLVSPCKLGRLWVRECQLSLHLVFGHFWLRFGAMFWSFCSIAYQPIRNAVSYTAGCKPGPHWLLPLPLSPCSIWRNGRRSKCRKYTDWSCSHRPFRHRYKRWSGINVFRVTLGWQKAIKVEEAQAATRRQPWFWSITCSQARSLRHQYLRP